MYNSEFKNAFEAINKAKNILLITHDRPDGDALSSICAMAEYLELKQKPYTMYCNNAPPIQYEFLPHVEKIIYEKSKLNINDFDYLIILDCGQMNRTKLTDEITSIKKSAVIIEFDHHPKVDDYANIELRLPELSSTCEVLYNFFKINQVKINKNIANCLLTGIMTDTGNLLFEITTDKTIKIASELLIYGARLPRILENTWRNKSLSGMQIWGLAMRRLKVNKKYNFAYTVLTREELENSKISDEELEGFPGFLSNLKGVNALLVLRELDNGKLKGSLRTAHPKIDISHLAKELGGGGHPRASAFVLEGQLERNNGAWRIV